ncbi:DUF1392 family protein [Nostoc sp. UHCC 0302]|uniref:DUF1392 family protein n=1 Tax=Nostoc sp. UHCC 0302 TaxID=3134896 RepID=UPI00311C8DD8
MIDQINSLYLCWYISPPWGDTFGTPDGDRIPPVEVNPLERVDIGASRTFGYCCGVQWKQDRWIYAIASAGEIIYTTEHEIIGTGEMQLAALEKPAFVLGDSCANVFDERIMLLSDDQRTKQRLILGIQLLNRSWFYYVEWMPPALKEVTSLDDRLAFVPQYLCQITSVQRP